MTERYPFLRSEELTTTTVFQRPVRTLVAGNGNRKVLYTAAHHANEWITAYVLLRFAEDLAEAAEQNGEIFGLPARELLGSGHDLHGPLVNPDRGGPGRGGHRRGPHLSDGPVPAAYYPGNPFPDGWKANLIGTDLNLNYPRRVAPGTGDQIFSGLHPPRPTDYVGNSPQRAGDTGTLAGYTEVLDPALVLAFHTQGQVIYWRFRDYEVPGRRNWARRFARVSGYVLDDTPYESSFAGFKDWFIQNTGGRGTPSRRGRGKIPAAGTI